MKRAVVLVVIGLALVALVTVGLVVTTARSSAPKAPYPGKSAVHFTPPSPSTPTQSESCVVTVTSGGRTATFSPGPATNGSCAAYASQYPSVTVGTFTAPG